MCAPEFEWEECGRERRASILHPHAQQIGEGLRDEVEFRRFAFARKHLPPRGVQIEEELPLRRVANEAPRPPDRGEARSARHGGDAVERRGGIGDQRPRSELGRFLTPPPFAPELAPPLPPPPPPAHR